jgi:hypothetical protein
MKKIKSNGFIEKVDSENLFLRIEDEEIVVSKKSLINFKEENLVGLPIKFEIKNGSPTVYLIIQNWTEKELNRAKKEAKKMKNFLKKS